MEQNKNEITIEAATQLANETETNLMRFMQIREDFHDSVREIKPIVASLKETNKSLVAHFEVLREISKNAEDNIEKVIESAGVGMGHAAAKEFDYTRLNVKNRQIHKFSL